MSERQRTFIFLAALLAFATLLFAGAGCAHKGKATTRAAIHDPREALAQVQRRVIANADRTDALLVNLDRKLPGDADVATIRAINSDNRDIAGEVAAASVTVGALVKENAGNIARADKAEQRAKNEHVKDWYWVIGAGILAAAIGGGLFATSYPMLRTIGIALLIGGIVAVAAGVVVTVLFVATASPVVPWLFGFLGVAAIGAGIHQYILFTKRQAERDRTRREMFLTVEAIKPLLPASQREQAKRIANAIQSPSTQQQVQQMQADPTVPSVDVLTATTPPDAVTSVETMTVQADSAVVNSEHVTTQ